MLNPLILSAVPYRNVLFAVAVGLAALLSLRYSGKKNSISNYLPVTLPYLMVAFLFVLSTNLDGDSWRTHFPKFNYICDAVADGHIFPAWFPSSGGIRIGVFHINFNQALPHRIPGYLLFALSPLSAVVAYKIQYLFGVILLGFGWWLVLKEITRSRYSAYLGTLMVLMGGTGITFHQEHALATTYLIPWFVLSLLKLKQNSIYIFPAVILFGLGLSTHYPQIQALSMGSLAIILIVARFGLFRSILREQRKFIPLLGALLIIALLPAYYVYRNADSLASVERQAYDSLRSTSYEDYLRIHQKTFSAAPIYFLQYITPRWSRSSSEPYPIDLRDRCSFFVGRIGLVLAALGVLLAFRKAWPIFILLIVFVALALGMYCPVPIPKYLFLLRFPFIDVFRQWVHFFPMVNFCLSALAALGFERLIYHSRQRFKQYSGGVIMLLIFVQTADLTIYDRKYLSLLWEETRPVDLLDRFYREETTESTVFQYKNRLELYQSCAEAGIPPVSFLTTEIATLEAGEEREIDKICEALKTENASAAIEIPASLLNRLIDPKEAPFRREVPVQLGYDGLSLSFSTPSPALLVVPLNYDLKAEAYLAGKKVRIWRVNGALSGVFVPEGSHRVSFQVRAGPYLPLLGGQWLLYGLVASFLIFGPDRKRK